MPRQIIGARIDADLYAKCKIAAAVSGQQVNTWVEKALVAALNTQDASHGPVSVRLTREQEEVLRLSAKAEEMRPRKRES